MVEETLLPPSALAKAIKHGNEYGWAQEDVPEVIDAAEAVGLANLGGQPQFVYPEGTCEPYWLNADAANQNEGETWDAYVARSASEVRAGFQRLLEEDEFELAARQFRLLAEKLDRGEDIMTRLRFVLYFAARPPAV